MQKISENFLGQNLQTFLDVVFCDCIVVNPHQKCIMLRYVTLDLPNFIIAVAQPNQVPGRDLNPGLNLQQAGVLTSKQ